MSIAATTESTGSVFRRRIRRGVTALSAAGLAVGTGIVATPAVAAAADECNADNTFVSGTHTPAEVQTFLDSDPAVLCLSGTFVLTEPLQLSSDLTVYGLDAAVLDGNLATRLLVGPYVDLTVDNVTFRNGKSGSDNGGAIEANAVTVTNSVFESNSAVNGGAIFGYGVSIEDSEFIDNAADLDGGAVYGDSEYGFGDLDITRSTFTGNTAGQFGGALYGSVAGSQTTIENSTFLGNAAGVEGGAVFAGESFVSFSTFLDNTINGDFEPTGTVTELPGEAIYLAVSDGEVLSIRGNIFAGDGANAQLGVGEVAPEPSPGAILDRGGNVFSTSATTEANFTSPDSSTQFGKTPAQIFGSTRVLADNGGTTRTLALVAGSPAIDAVPPLVTPDSAPAAEYAPAAQADVVLDQRGNARSGLLDAGSFEFVPPAPQLAETGADSGVTGWLAGIGAFLLAAGIAVAATARRRANR